MKAIHHLNQKLMSPHQLDQWLIRWRLQSKKVVFTNGVFDILHAGHIHSLKQAASFGNILIIGINSDASTRRLKGESRPIQTLEDRAEVLCALEMVDAVIAFEEDTPLELIKRIKPDVLVKGGDYTIETIAGAKEVLDFGGVVEIIPLIPGRSTTRLAEVVSGL
jgi:D-beta-D-heptose 7-phosphate kinase/D-beta-D-heptose 1-phosphate adenosyltransferase